MKTRDTAEPTMSREEMADDYSRLKREYTLLHEEYRRLQSEKDKQLKLYGVVKSLPTEECVREWYKEGNNDAGFWTTKIEIDNETVFTEVYKALKYFINRWQ
jgi:ABC-type phosphate transport system auxiliary subunit